MKSNDKKISDYDMCMRLFLLSSFPSVASIHDRHVYTLAGKREQYVSVLMMVVMTRLDCIAVLLLFTRPV